MIRALLVGRAAHPRTGAAWTGVSCASALGIATGVGAASGLSLIAGLVDVQDTGRAALVVVLYL